MKIHEKYINRCIQLAKNGLGTTYPNPMVGCVIVYEDQIIGEGWHRKAGQPHAEVHAINSVKNKKLLLKATLYVSLEPCSHYGKTPPCSNLIIESGIKKVVIGSVDQNSKVKGKGIAYLEKHGCEVIYPVLKNNCEQLNKRFFNFHLKKRPFIILKWAETFDGFIDKKRSDNFKNQPNWISNKYAQQLAHKLRVTEPSILVGTSTVLNDNPSLTARSWSGENPVRLVIDRTNKIPLNAMVLNGEVLTIVFTKKTTKNSLNNVLFKEIDFNKNVPIQICEELYKLEIQSVVVEGGAKTIQSFIGVNLWDEAFVFKSKHSFKIGLEAPKLEADSNTIIAVEDNDLIYYKNDK
ncbi:MAG: bifunctional diaminohydroxyphosphoribosylaminopyrimidine deaminase/5-amino-6-(5-phosphoribosylamino)uracil reductase RibD [Lutibacter sp.]